MKIENLKKILNALLEGFPLRGIIDPNLVRSLLIKRFLSVRRPTP